MNPSLQLAFDEIRRRFDELDARMERRFSRTMASPEQQGATVEPRVSSPEKFGATQLVVADNWGCLFDGDGDTVATGTGAPVVADNWGSLFNEFPAFSQEYVPVLVPEATSPGSDAPPFAPDAALNSEFAASDKELEGVELDEMCSREFLVDDLSTPRPLRHRRLQNAAPRLPLIRRPRAARPHPPRLHRTQHPHLHPLRLHRPRRAPPRPPWLFHPRSPRTHGHGSRRAPPWQRRPLRHLIWRPPWHHASFDQRPRRRGHRVRGCSLRSDLEAGEVLRARHLARNNRLDEARAVKPGTMLRLACTLCACNVGDTSKSDRAVLYIAALWRHACHPMTLVLSRELLPLLPARCLTLGGNHVKCVKFPHDTNNVLHIRFLYVEFHGSAIVQFGWARVAARLSKEFISFPPAGLSPHHSDRLRPRPHETGAPPPHARPARAHLRRHHCGQEGVMLEISADGTMDADGCASRAEQGCVLVLLHEHALAVMGSRLGSTATVDGNPRLSCVGLMKSSWDGRSYWTNLSLWLSWVASVSVEGNIGTVIVEFLQNSGSSQLSGTRFTVSYECYKCREYFLWSQLTVPWSPPVPICPSTALTPTRLLKDLVWWLYTKAWQAQMDQYLQFSYVIDKFLHIITSVMYLDTTREIVECLFLGMPSPALHVCRSLVVIPRKIEVLQHKILGEEQHFLRLLTSQVTALSLLYILGLKPWPPPRCMENELIQVDRTSACTLQIDNYTGYGLLDKNTINEQIQLLGGDGELQHHGNSNLLVKSHICLLQVCIVEVIAEHWGTTEYNEHTLRQNVPFTLRLHLHAYSSGYEVLQAAWANCLSTEHHGKLIGHQWVQTKLKPAAAPTVRWMQILADEQDTKKLQAQENDVTLQVTIKYTLVFQEQEDKHKWLILAIQELQSAWDPGGSKSGLGASRILSGGECQVRGLLGLWQSEWMGLQEALGPSQSRQPTRLQREDQPHT